jgi:hypothetical protein
MSHLAVALGGMPFDLNEEESGAQAFGALLWERGQEINATTLVLMWLLSVGSPRVPQIMEKRKKAGISGKEVTADGIAQAREQLSVVPKPA